MKTIIYYFTGTGNSLKIAQDLAAKIGDTELIPMAKVIHQQQITVSSDRIGIVFPVYIWGMPSIVTKFVDKLNTPSATYIFGVANYGGFPAGTLLQLQKQLAQKELTLSAGFGIRMPGNYTPMYGALPDEKQKKLFEKCASKINAIADIVKKGYRAPIEKNAGIINALFSGLLYRAAIQQIYTMDASFWVDERCNGCGVCAQICPVVNVAMENDRPKWLHHCEQCMACLQWCPQTAIQYGKNTRNRKRYHHPAVTVSDLRTQQG